jgi:hypothetical protein
MMALDRRQLERLLTLVADTRDDEIACDECLAGMAEFAEQRLAGVEIREALRRIELHLASCPECTEEYELLLAVLRDEGSAGGT